MNDDDLLHQPSTSTGQRGGRPPPPLPRHFPSSYSYSSLSSSSEEEDAGARDDPTEDEDYDTPPPQNPHINTIRTRSRTSSSTTTRTRPGKAIRAGGRKREFKVPRKTSTKKVTSKNTIDPNDSEDSDDPDLKIKPSYERFPQLKPDPTSPNHFAEKFTVEYLTDRDWDTLTGEKIYQVKWVGWTKKDNTWEQITDLEPKKVKVFEDRQTAKGKYRSSKPNKEQAEIEVDKRIILTTKKIISVRSMEVGCAMAATEDTYDLHFEGGDCIALKRSELLWLGKDQQDFLFRWVMRNEEKIGRLRAKLEKRMLKLAWANMPPDNEESPPEFSEDSDEKDSDEKWDNGEERMDEG